MNKDFPNKYYKNSKCDRTECTNKAIYVVMVGEADITCCEKHKKDAKMEQHEIREKIKTIIDNNTEEIPYEGTDINKEEMEEDLILLYEDIKKTLYENNKK